MGWPFGRSHPADEGLSRREIRALENERLFPNSTIKKRGKDAIRQGKEASARGDKSFGRKVIKDPDGHDGHSIWKLW